MKAHESFLISVLADYVNCRKTSAIPENCDMEAFAQCAAEQGVGGIAYVQCRDAEGMKPEALSSLHNRFISDVFRSTCFSEDYAELCAALRGAEIPFLQMKGPALAKYHAAPQLRTMGDIDLVIHREDRMPVHELLTGMGYEHYIDNPVVWTYKRDEVSYEIHDRMFYEKLSNDVDYMAYYDGVWEHELEGEIQPEFQFLYLMTHTAKHITNRGSGLRPFLDMAFMAQRENLDWQYIENELKTLKLLDFSKRCFALCEDWFGVDMPLEKDGIDREFLDFATEKVFADGLFGLENEENQFGALAKKLQREDEAYVKSAAGLMLGKLFPAYDDMRLVEQYSFLNGRKWLLPAAWLYRFGYCAVNKLPHSVKDLAEPVAKKKEIDARREYIRKWGL